jgi:hypothetical protein
MKKIIIAFVLCTSLAVAGKVNAQCSQSGTTATCLSTSNGNYLVSYNDYFYPGSGIPLTFYIDLVVYSSGGFAAMEVDWGYSGMEWNTIYSGEAHYSIPISSSENNNGLIWLETATTNGYSRARAIW